MSQALRILPCLTNGIGVLPRSGWTSDRLGHNSTMGVQRGVGLQDFEIDIFHRDLKPAQLPSRNENGTDLGKRREKREDDPASTFGSQSVRYSFCATVGNQTNSRGFTPPSSYD